MRWWYLLGVSVTTLSILAGVAGALPQRSLAPALETPYSKSPQLPAAQSLEDLYQMRDRFWAELEQREASRPVLGLRMFSAPTELVQKLQAVEIWIQVEETAEKNWDRAIQLARQATELSKLATPSVAAKGYIHSLWSEAVDALHEVPLHTFLFATATQKLQDYEASLAIASYNYDTARSDFLKPIAERTGLPASQVFITVCHLDGECRRWQGNTPPASPASLIKVPIAIAVMQKITDEAIKLDTTMMVSRSNYTEDASDIWVGTEYTLLKLLRRMINQSSNIATNQFIDYLGSNYINQVLRDRGFTVTAIHSKLVGDHTYPANLGSQPNRFTTDELTEMMRQIYRQQHPGDEMLIDALASQEDLVLGYEGLKKTRAIWIGEKTGQTSKMLGTTLAFTINDEYYVATVALNYSANERAVQQCINDIAKHIEQQGHL